MGWDKKGKHRIPTIDFQVQTVSFREGNSILLRGYLLMQKVGGVIVGWKNNEYHDLLLWKIAMNFVFDLF